MPSHHQGEEDKRVTRITQGKQTFLKRGSSRQGADRAGSFRRSIRLKQKAPPSTPGAGAAASSSSSETVGGKRTESTRRKHRDSEGESCK